MTRRSRIVCTIGPASESLEGLRGLAEAGMDVARLNTSHGDLAWHRRAIRRVRRVERAIGRPLAILLDLGGPKVRVAQMSAETLDLHDGQEVRVFPRGPRPTGPWLTLSDEVGLERLRVGDRLILSDGAVSLGVTRIDADGARCVVSRGGLVRWRAGVYLPDTPLSLASLTERDLAALEMGVSAGVDWFALSYVRRASDVLDLKQRLRALASDAPVLAKIEEPSAVEHLDEILDVADGAMVARGDLGVAIGIENVPLVQKRILAACARRSLPSITATQMLESMVHAAVPTRAEAADVANAILDGTDAIMLSAETSVGAYPFEACAVAARICQRVDEAALARRPEPAGGDDDPSHAVADAAAMLAQRLSATVVIACTLSGGTARRVAARRPMVPILAASAERATLRRLALVWGVMLRPVPVSRTTDHVIAEATKAARAAGLIVEGAPFVVTAGHPPGASGRTNLIRVGVG